MDRDWQQPAHQGEGAVVGVAIGLDCMSESSLPQNTSLCPCPRSGKAAPLRPGQGRAARAMLARQGMLSRRGHARVGSRAHAVTGQSRTRLTVAHTLGPHRGRNTVHRRRASGETVKGRA